MNPKTFVQIFLLGAFCCFLFVNSNPVQQNQQQPEVRQLADPAAVIPSNVLPVPNPQTLFAQLIKQVKSLVPNEGFSEQLGSIQKALTSFLELALSPILSATGNGGTGQQLPKIPLIQSRQADLFGTLNSLNPVKPLVVALTGTAPEIHKPIAGLITALAEKANDAGLSPEQQCAAVGVAAQLHQKGTEQITEHVLGNKNKAQKASEVAKSITPGQLKELEAINKQFQGSVEAIAKLAASSDAPCVSEFNQQAIKHLKETREIVRQSPGMTWENPVNKGLRDLIETLEKAEKSQKKQKPKKAGEDQRSTLTKWMDLFRKFRVSFF